MPERRCDRARTKTSAPPRAVTSSDLREYLRGGPEVDPLHDAGHDGEVEDDARLALVEPGRPGPVVDVHRQRCLGGAVEEGRHLVAARDALGVPARTPASSPAMNESGASSSTSRAQSPTRAAPMKANTPPPTSAIRTSAAT